MKLAACFLTLLPGFAVAASWTSPGFPAFSEQGTGTFVSHAQLPKGTRPLTLNFDQQCWQPADAIKLNQMLSLQPCSNTPPQWRLFRDGEYTLQLDTRSGTPTLMISLQNTVEPVASLVRECPKWDGLPLTLDVSATFAEGAAVRDYYSQQIAIVKNGQITLQPAATSNGLLLLERAETDTSAPFDWHNATVYFVLTDRFENGDPSNDQSYGRHKDGMAEIGTFHGGDLRGLTNKLDYLQQLGVNALWISAPFEQIHGWVGGGTKGDFPHYAYHGYYTQDWTNLDANMGSEADLRTLVDSAHQRGIRILFDIVMNHTGYATLADMQEYQFGALYLSGDELKKRWVNAGATGNLPPGKPGIALTITLISATKQAGINGGEKTGSERISAITTILDSTISLCRWPFCRISKPNQLPLLVCQCSIKTKRIPTLKSSTALPLAIT